MKKLLLAICFLLPLKGMAGEDVPWPLSMQESINFKHVQGLWVSVHQKEPFAYDIQVSVTGFVSCPHVLMVSEIDTTNGRVKTSGARLCCRGEREFNMVLFDGEGRAKNSLSMVGLMKKTSILSDSYQYLGLTMLDYTKGNRITQDVFYKYSF